MHPFVSIRFKKRMKRTRCVIHFTMPIRFTIVEGGGGRKAGVVIKRSPCMPADRVRGLWRTLPSFLPHTFGQ